MYNPTLSSTSKKLDGYTWEILYGDGSGASGDVGTDTVKIGTTTVTGQAVELADEISYQFQNDINNDGILGLGFDSINTGKLFTVVGITTSLPIAVQPVRQKTFFSNAKASLSAPLFTANLKKGKPGCYTFGYVNAAEYTGSITYVPANSDNGFWEFTSNGYAVGTAAFRSSSFIANPGTYNPYQSSLNRSTADQMQSTRHRHHAGLPSRCYRQGLLWQCPWFRLQLRPGWLHIPMLRDLT